MGVSVLRAYMWLRSRVTSVITSVAATRSRRIAVFCLLVLFLIYVLEEVLPSNDHGLRVETPSSCLDIALHPFVAAQARGETIIVHSSRLVQTKPATVVGNGFTGLSMDEPHLLLMHAGTLSRWLPYSPLITVTIAGKVLDPDATVVEFREAVIHRIYTHRMSTGCLRVRQSVYAHRSRSSLLVQELVMQNTAGSAVKVGLKQYDANPWTGSSSQRHMLPGNLQRAHTKNYLLVSGQLMPDPASVTPQPTLDVSIASMDVPEEDIVVPDSGQESLQLLAVVKSKASSGNQPLGGAQAHSGSRELASQATSELQGILAEKSHDFRQEHTLSWHELWQSGATVISESHPSIPANDDVFASVYYLLSSTPSLGEKARDPSNDKDRETCFSGPPTMHTASLWQIPRTLESVAILAGHWLKTLSDQGCAGLVKQGVQMVAQAVALSFIGLRHVARYLELALNPALVQADVQVRNIHYHSRQLTVTIRLKYGTANHVLLSAKNGIIFWPPDNLSPARGKTQSHSKDVPVTPLFACPASCKGQPQKIGMDEVSFPVIATKPVTPLLYISASADHLLQLQNRSKQLHTYHLPGEHHHWGVHTVPALVWVLLFIVFLVFHLFLARIIYKEYCSPNVSNSSGGVSSFQRTIFGGLRTAE